MRLVEEIQMTNGLVAEIWDQSRTIAVDTTKVTLLVRIKVILRPDFFPDPEQFRITTEVFGPEVSYEFKKERTFVPKAETWYVFKIFTDEFKRDLLPYLSKEKFPACFARSKYLDIQKNPYKYGQPVRNPQVV